MPKRVCLTPGCNRLIPDTRSYCQRHDRKRQRKRNPARGSGWQIAKWRAKALAQTGGRCARCGSLDSIQVHHVVPLAKGGHPFGPAVPLCLRCHSKERTT